MANNPQNEQQKTPKSEESRFAQNKPEQDRDREQKAANPQDRDRYAGQTQKGQSANSGRDDSLVGVDTDGDGKVVKPGQKPGQSHGHGLPENKPGYDAGKKN